MANRRLFWRLTAVAVGAAMLPSALVAPAGADESAKAKAEVAQIQVRLAKAQDNVNNLLQKATDSAEEYNGAVYEERKAEEAWQLLNTKSQVADRRQRVARQRVEAVTVDELQSGGRVATWSSLLDAAGPTELLERSTAYDSTADALSAQLDDLLAQATVTKVLRTQAAAAEVRKKAALARAKSAKKAAYAQLAEARVEQAKLKKERAKALKRLAYLEKKKLAEIRARQAAIERAARLAASRSAAAPAAPRHGSSKGAEIAISFALAQVGKPYVWGAAGPSSYDCSGLMLRALEQDGIYLPHFSGAQYASLTPVSMSSIRRGDLVFWSHGGPGSIHHVAMYLGDGMIVEAPRTGLDVQVRSISAWTLPDLAARPSY